MDYQLLYNNLISRAKQAELIECYVERHHIMPKCMGGTDGKDNKAKLTAREHFIAHKLLHKIYPNEKGLLIAVWQMSLSGRYKVSNKEYEKLRVKWGMFQSERMRGKNNINYGNHKRIPWNKGKKGAQIAWNKGLHWNEKTRQNISKAIKGKMSGENNSFYGKHHTEAAKEKSRKKHMGKQSAFKGHKHSEETKQKMKASWKRRLQWIKEQKQSGVIL